MGLNSNPVFARFFTTYKSCHNCGSSPVSGVDPSAYPQGQLLCPYCSVTQHGGPASLAILRSPNVALLGHATHGDCPDAGGGAGVPRVGAMYSGVWHGKQLEEGSRVYGSDAMVAHDVEKLSEWFIFVLQIEFLQNYTSSRMRRQCGLWTTQCSRW